MTNNRILVALICWMTAAAAFAFPMGDYQGAIANATRINIHAFDTDETGRLMIDRRGMMWIGSSNGLVSFDGYRFKTYKSDAFSPGILPNNVIVSMTEDHDGNIYIGTRDGLVKVDRLHGRFKTYHLPGQNQRIIYCLYTSKDGTLWIGTDGGLTRYDRRKDSFYTYNLGYYYSVKSITEDKQGYLYFGTWDSGLMRLRPDRKRVDRYPPMNSDNSAYSLLIDSRRRLWIGTWEHGIAMIENPDNTKHPVVHKYNDTGKGFKIINNIIEDPVSKKIWACSRDGICIFDEISGDFVNYPQYKFCSDIVTDGKGHIYVGTTDNGILKFDTTPRDFTFHNLDQSNYHLPFGSVESIYTADGRWFWLGLKPCGLALYDISTGRTMFNAEIPVMGSHPEAADLTKAIIPSMAGCRGDLWMANSSYGVFVITKDGEVKHLNRANSKFLIDDYVNYVYTDRSGNVWIGQRNGLSVAYSLTSGKSIRLKSGSDDFSVCDVTSISQDSKGNYWITTENEGIICLTGNPRQPERMKIKHYYPGNGKYVVGDANACLEDSRKRLWAVSSSGGLFEYDAKQDCFVPRNRDFKMMDSRAYTIVEDQYRCLWLTTEDALLRLSFDKGSTPSVMLFPNEDGQGKRFLAQNTICQYGGRLYMGGQNGIISLAPQIPDSRDQLSKNFMVTDIYINDKPLMSLDSALRARITEYTPSCAQSITLPPAVHKFSVEFALLNYFTQDKTMYAYFLEGYDDEWHYVDATRRRAIYENLPSGTYYLHLKADDNFGKTHTLPYTIKVRILPPWYQTWWAYAGYLLLLVGMIYIGVLWYRNHVKTNNRLRMAVVFTNITHELLTPLTVISAVAAEMKAKEPKLGDDYSVIDTNIKKITRLLRQILEVRKSQAGQLKLKVSQGNLGGYVAGVCDNIQPMVSAKDIKLTLVDNAGEKLDSVWFDTDKMDKILYNLISNSAKYGREGGFIRVTLDCDGEKATITVADNGIGMNRQQLRQLYTRFLDGDYRKMQTAGTGIGLSLTRDLVVLHHGSIHCESRENEGTTFTVVLPIMKRAYAPEEIELPSADIILDDDLQGHVTGYSYPAAADAHEGRKEYRLLLVEDNEELLNLMQHLLGRKYDVLTARNGKQALRVIYKEELDIVVSDVMMPIMDGIELTKTVKGDKNYAQLPVILLTAKTNDEDRNSGLQVGADDYICKPFSLAALQLRIDNIIENHRRIRVKFTSQMDFKVKEQHYSNPDEAFIQKAIDCVKAHLEDSDYDRAAFAKDMCVSASTLYNRLRTVTGQSISGFIMSVRLKEACLIARQEPGVSVTELSIRVGFNTPKYFAKCFKKEFGMIPSDYLKKVGSTSVPAQKGEKE